MKIISIKKILILIYYQINLYNFIKKKYFFNVKFLDSKKKLQIKKSNNLKMRALLLLLKLIVIIIILDHILNHSCEKDFLPRNSDDCLSQTLDNENEVCCFIYAQPYESWDLEKQCVIIKKEDAKDERS